MVSSCNHVFALGYIRGSRLLPRLSHSIHPLFCYIHHMVSMVSFHVHVDLVSLDLKVIYFEHITIARCMIVKV